MRLFGKRILIFLLPPLIIIFSLDTFLRVQNDMYKEKYNGAIENKDSIEVIILGNSHATYAVDPTAFDLYAYNLAYVNQSIYFDKRITLSLMNKLEKLRYVLISVDFHSFSFSSQGIRDVWSYYGNGIKYKDRNYLLENLSPSLFGYTPKVALSLLKKRIIKAIKYRNETVITCDVEKGINLKDTIKKGFVSFEVSKESAFTEKELKKKADGYNGMVKKYKKIRQEVINDLEDFIQILIDNNITPVLFTAPVYKGYYSFLDTTALRENKKILMDLCRKYDIKYWDFSNLNIMTQDDFYNCDHLNKKGAHKFSVLLSDSILDINNKVAEIREN
jgi:hypothetical protein